MSFSLTIEPVANQKKTVTRRFGWYFLKPGDLIQPAERKKKIGGLIRVASVRLEPLSDIGKSFPHNDECIKEGFPFFEPFEFVRMFVRHHGCCPSDIINRIEFEYV